MRRWECVAPQAGNRGATAETDENGLFQVEMPVGLDGNVTATAKLPREISPQQTVQAGDLTPGLSLPDDGFPPLIWTDLGVLSPILIPTFFSHDFSDADWKDIKVPSHWIMEGLTATTEPADIAGICKFRQLPRSPHQTAL